MAALRTRITHPDGQSFDYSYDGLNRQEEIVEESSSASLHSSEYNSEGELITATRLAGIETEYEYDDAGRVDLIDLRLAGSAEDNSFSFTYTPASQIKTRITSNDKYAHRAHFNVDRSYAVNGLNQYTSVGEYTVSHDDNGNLTSDGGVSFTYDTENRLTGASGAKNAALVYDPLGRLYETSDGAGGGITRFLYDGDALVAEYDASATITARYIHGSGVDQPLIWYDGSAVNASTRRHLFANWQGSITAITDASGNAIAVNAYDAHGIPNPDNLGRFGFTGQIHIPELGLNYFKARMRSPYIDRFLQTDPIGYDDGFHLYRYAGNDPVNRVDPTGTQSCETVNCDTRPKPEANENTNREGSNIVTRTLANIIAPLTGGEAVDSVEGSIIDAIEAPLDAADSVAAAFPAAKAGSGLIKGANKTAGVAIKPLKANKVTVRFKTKKRVQVPKPKTGKARVEQPDRVPDEYRMSQSVPRVGRPDQVGLRPTPTTGTQKAVEGFRRFLNFIRKFMDD